ncbi:uncharacterized protein [Leptinotarsa decemlineata]|uniref:uncharacterized protein n=1 Tax=Leptinotarsa decemlineata TaxID=7539 RepID=UPI003D307010
MSRDMNVTGPEDENLEGESDSVNQTGRRGQNSCSLRFPSSQLRAPTSVMERFRRHAFGQNFNSRSNPADTSSRRKKKIAFILKRPVSVLENPVSEEEQSVPVEESGSVEQQSLSDVEQEVPDLEQSVRIVEQLVSVVEETVSEMESPAPVCEQQIPVVAQLLSVAQQTLTVVEQPGSVVKQPGLDEKPTPIVKQSVSGVEEFVSGKESPGLVCEQPVSDSEQLMSVAQQTVPFMEQSDSVIKQPVPDDGTSATIVEQSVSVFEEMVSEEESPGPVCQQPVPDGEQSLSVTQQPDSVVTVEQSMSIFEEMVPEEDSPGRVCEQPVHDGEKSLSVAQQTVPFVEQPDSVIMQPIPDDENSATIVEQSAVSVVVEIISEEESPRIVCEQPDSDGEQSLSVAQQTSPFMEQPDSVDIVEQSVSFVEEILSEKESSGLMCKQPVPDGEQSLSVAQQTEPFVEQPDSIEVLVEEILSEEESSGLMCKQPVPDGEQSLSVAQQTEPFVEQPDSIEVLVEEILSEKESLGLVCKQPVPDGEQSLSVAQQTELFVEQPYALEVLVEEILSEEESPGLMRKQSNSDGEQSLSVAQQTELFVEQPYALEVLVEEILSEEESPGLMRKQSNSDGEQSLSVAQQTSPFMEQPDSVDIVEQSVSVVEEMVSEEESPGLVCEQPIPDGEQSRSVAQQTVPSVEQPYSIVEQPIPDDEISATIVKQSGFVVEEMVSKEESASLSIAQQTVPFVERPDSIVEQPMAEDEKLAPNVLEQEVPSGQQPMHDVRRQNDVEFQAQLQIVREMCNTAMNSIPFLAEPVQNYSSFADENSINVIEFLRQQCRRIFSDKVLKAVNTSAAGTSAPPQSGSDENNRQAGCSSSQSCRQVQQELLNRMQDCVKAFFKQRWEIEQLKLSLEMMQIEVESLRRIADNPTRNWTSAPFDHNPFPDQRNTNYPSTSSGPNFNQYGQQPPFTPNFNQFGPPPAFPPNQNYDNNSNWNYPYLNSPLNTGVPFGEQANSSQTHPNLMLNRSFPNIPPPNMNRSDNSWNLRSRSHQNLFSDYPSSSGQQFGNNEGISNYMKSSTSQPNVDNQRSNQYAWPPTSSDPQQFGNNQRVFQFNVPPPTLGYNQRGNQYREPTQQRSDRNTTPLISPNFTRNQRGRHNSQSTNKTPIRQRNIQDTATPEYRGPPVPTSQQFVDNQQDDQQPALPSCMYQQANYQRPTHFVESPTPSSARSPVVPSQECNSAVLKKLIDDIINSSLVDFESTDVRYQIRKEKMFEAVSALFRTYSNIPEFLPNLIRELFNLGANLWDSGMFEVIRRVVLQEVPQPFGNVRLTPNEQVAAEVLESLSMNTNDFSVPPTMNTFNTFTLSSFIQLPDCEVFQDMYDLLKEIEPFLKKHSNRTFDRELLESLRDYIVESAMFARFVYEPAFRNHFSSLLDRILAQYCRNTVSHVTNHLNQSLEIFVAPEIGLYQYLQRHYPITDEASGFDFNIPEIQPPSEANEPTTTTGESVNTTRKPNNSRGNNKKKRRKNKKGSSEANSSQTDVVVKNPITSSTPKKGRK